MTDDNIHIGSNFDDFLEEEELLEESTIIAIRRVLEVVKVQKNSRTLSDEEKIYFDNQVVN